MARLFLNIPVTAQTKDPSRAAEEAEVHVEIHPQAEIWDQWLEANAARLLVYARQQTRCGSDAEDVLQEALVEAWERSGGKAPPIALVVATIRRRAIDLARSSDRRSKREDYVMAEAGEELWFEPDMADGESRRVLDDAVKRLPAAQQEVVTLKTWSGLTFQEIADLTGTPLNTVTSRYRYGLESLRKLLNEVLK